MVSSFYDIYKRYITTGILSCDLEISPEKVASVLRKKRINADDFFVLLSPAANGFLEQMAQSASSLTRRHFGRTILLFTPLYVSNFCENTCRYCSFSRHQQIERLHLDFTQIDHAAKQIAQSGIRHILILTGEAPKLATIDYLGRAVEILRKHFSAITIEVYALGNQEYATLIEKGVDGLTIYQEVYNEERFVELHEGGPKADYKFRLDAPQRAAEAGIRSITVGPLLGLADPVCEVFFAGLHADYLMRLFPGLEVSVSLPRIRPLVSDFLVPNEISDSLYVQMLAALRLFLPSAGITVTTRESAGFRDAILPICVTKMSAGVSTSVGAGTTDGQFEIADNRSVDEMKNDLLRIGFQPVMHDWNATLLRGV